MNNDQKAEHAILRAGLTAPRITQDQVNDLMARIRIDTMVLPGTTTTIASANLVSRDGSRTFSLAIGHSACVSPENFNAQIGIDLATRNAERMAKDKLWEMLGFGLFQELDK